jgi:uncharacterized membrane protein YjjP (DUF1212 family)
VLRTVESDPNLNLRRLSDLQAIASRLRGSGVATSADLAGTRREIAEIVSRPAPFGAMAVGLAYGVYGAAVSARVGGGWTEVLAGIAVGLVAGLVHFGSTRSRRLDLLQSFTGALCGTLAAFLLRRALPPFDEARAVYGGISLLAPGTMLTIGTLEIVHEAPESGVLRLAYALLRFVMMGFGAAVALQVYGLFGSPPGAASPQALPKLIQFGLVTLGGLALTVCLQGRWRDAPWMVAGVVVAFGSEELSKLLLPPDGSPFLAMFLLTAVAIGQYRLGGRLPAVLIIPGFLQIAPSFLGTESVLALLRPGAHHEAGDTFFHVMLLALQLVTGLLIAEAAFGWRGPRAARGGTSGDAR